MTPYPGVHAPETGKAPLFWVVGTGRVLSVKSLAGVVDEDVLRFVELEFDEDATKDELRTNADEILAGLDEIDRVTLEELGADEAFKLELAGTDETVGDELDTIALLEIIEAVDDGSVAELELTAELLD